MSNVGFATMQVIPVLAGIAGKISGELGGEMTTAGKKAGADAGAAIAAGLESAKGKVSKASENLAKARDKEATAAEKVQVAEAKLQTLRDKGVTDAGRLTAAEAAVSKAKRDHSAASRGLESSAKAEADAQKKLADAEKESAEQADKLAKSAGDAGDAIDDASGKSTVGVDSIAKWGAAAGAAVLAAGAGLYKIGEVFDDVADTIRIGTGATGANLDALTDVAKRVGTQVPAEFGDIGTAVADLNTRLGLTGPDLEQVTAQVMELGNMGEQVDINTLSQAMSAFGVESSQVSGTLDELFRVSQATGVPVGKLAETAVKGAPALKQFGFGAASSAGLIGSLDKAGLDADKMMMGLTKSLSAFAKAGEDPQKALYGSVVEIEKFTQAGNDAAAIDMAAKLFGTRGAAQFVDAVKSGTFSVDDFVSATGAGADTIRGASEDTYDFAENWQLLKNRGMAALEPVASKLFGVIGEGMGFIADKAVPALEKMFGFVGDNKTAFSILGGILATVVTPAITLYAIEQAKAVATSIVGNLSKIVGAWKTMGTALKSSAAAQWAMNSAVLANPLTWILVALVAVGVALWAFFTKTETGRKLWDKIWGGIKAAVAGVVDWFKNTAWPWLQGVFQRIGQIATWLWQNVMLPAWNGIKAAVGAVWGWISGTLWPGLQTVFRGVGRVVMWLWQNVMLPAWNGIKAAIGIAWGVIQAIFAAWRGAFNVVATVALWLWHNIITPVWDGIKAAISVAWDIISGIFDRMKQGFQNIADKAGEVKDWIIDKWNAVVDFFTGVKDKIASAASGMWDGIKDAFRGVINWIIRAWNSLQFTVPTIEAFGKKMGGFSIGVPKIPELATGGRVAAGRRRDGLLFGPGDGTSDSILGVGRDGIPTAAVSAGEFVVNEKATRRWLPLLQMLNAGRKMFASRFGMPALAAGGVVGGTGGALEPWPGGGGEANLKPVAVMVRRLIHKFWPEIADIGGYRASDPYPDHPSGQALDIMISDVGLGDRVKAWLMANKSVFDLNYTIWQQKHQAADGEESMMEDRGSPTQNHMDHIHALLGEIGSPPDVDPDVVPAGLQAPDGATVSAADPIAPDSDDGSSGSGSGGTGERPRMKSFRELGQDVGGIMADGIAETLGLPTWITDPGNAIKIDKGESVRTSGTDSTDPTPGGVSPQETPDSATTAPSAGALDAKDYAGWITKAAKDLQLPERAAVIGNATGLVESGNPMQMYANNGVPESLNYPHDAVGSDHDSVGLFQQRDNGAWGTVADRMDPYKSALMFYRALIKVPGWETMPEGDAAQATQRSAFPDRYAGMLPAARELVKKTGLYDSGGWLMPGQIATNQLRRPEPVLHPSHWDAIVDQTDAVRELVGVGGRGGMQVTIHGQTTGDIITELRRNEWRGARGYGSRTR